MRIAVHAQPELTASPRVVLVTIGTPFLSRGSLSYWRLLRKNAQRVLIGLCAGIASFYVLYFLGKLLAPLVYEEVVHFFNAWKPASYWFDVFLPAASAVVGGITIAQTSIEYMRRRRQAGTAEVDGDGRGSKRAGAVVATEQRQERAQPPPRRSHDDHVRERNWRDLRIFSSRDEAINALSLAPTQRVDLVTAGLVRWPVGVVLGLIAFGLLATLDFFSAGSSLIRLRGGADGSRHVAVGAAVR